MKKIIVTLIAIALSAGMVLMPGMTSYADSQYVVKKGDSLWKIAKTKLGNGAHYTKIYEANKNIIKNPNFLKVGWKLSIPDGSISVETNVNTKPEANAAPKLPETIEVVNYPKIAYIDNVNYYGTDKKCEAVPRKAPDGVIETFVSKEIMPDAYNSANFGAEQGKLEYMFVEDGRLIIHLGEDWYYFEKR